MNKCEKAVQKSIESANELLKLLDWIKNERTLTSGEEKVLRKDIDSIQEIKLLLEQAHSKEQIREVWNTFREIDRNFGGYIGDRVGRLLTAAQEKLWKNLLDALSESQNVNNSNSNY